MRKGFLAKERLMSMTLAVKPNDFGRQTQWVWQPKSMGLASKVNAITKSYMTTSYNYASSYEFIRRPPSQKEGWFVHSNQPSSV